MRKITQEEIANRINVSSRTVRNWENEKPELLRLLRTAIENESFHMDFWDLFDNNKDIDLMHDPFIDFYFRFLNYFRKNITTLSKINDGIKTDISSTLITYLIQHNKESLFDNEFLMSHNTIEVLQREEYIRPFLSNCNKELSEYILRNTIDDFETLVQDSMGVDKLFINAIKVSMWYIIFKYEPEKPFYEKEDAHDEMLNKIGVDIDSVKRSIRMNKKALFKAYIEVKDEYSKLYLNMLNDETKYKTNSFYIPAMVKRIESKL